jgi:hypothetical protein
MSRYKSIDSFVILGRVDPPMVLAHHDSEDDSTHRTRRLAPPEIVVLMDRSYLDELVGVVVYLSLLVMGVGGGYINTNHFKPMYRSRYSVTI